MVSLEVVTALLGALPQGAPGPPRALKEAAREQTPCHGLAFRQDCASGWWNPEDKGWEVGTPRAALRSAARPASLCSGKPSVTRRAQAGLNQVFN